MAPITRRSFIQLAIALGAASAWADPFGAKSQIQWTERRDLYPEGVASGDPDEHSVLLWTRHSPGTADSAELTVEVAEDESFSRVVATVRATISQDSDWTCRVLVGGLKPSHVYWYRFTDAKGFGSRVGRTITAPSITDPRPVRFAFVSCQNANQGAQNAYRRMIFEDERAAAPDQLGFVLHLGDFIYEIVWYPEDRPQGMYDRRLRDIVRYAHGEKIDDFHIPTTVDDYRAVYRGYLHDPDLQDARARWPFVNMWDNHEFSWKGWQGLQKFDGTTRPAQTRKVAANQAFFEYQPARMSKPSGPSFDRFGPPKVVDAPITHFDDHGLGQEPNNLTAIGSLKGYRALRWGRNLELIVTDQRSYRSEDPTDREEAAAFTSKDFPELMPEEAMEILDAGRTYNHGQPPASIRFGNVEVPNFWKGRPAQTILGAEQMTWFLEHVLPKDHPLRPLFVGQGPEDRRPQPTLNLLMRHGVRSCLEYTKSGDIVKARQLSNPSLSPHLSFVDMGGHGYSIVRVASDELETEFVCIPRPLERSDGPDGGPLAYRVKHRARLWQKGEPPKLETIVVEGDPKFSL